MCAMQESELEVTVVGMLMDPGPFDRELVRNLAAAVGCAKLLEELLGEARAR
jgi:hypothetical protein